MVPVSHARVSGLAVALVTSLTMANLVAAASPEGIWRTEPDRKGQTAHVVAVPCGGALCGTIQKVFDRSGQSVKSPNLGVRVFWNMRPAGNTYKGRAFVPAFGREYDAKMQMTGNKLKVSGCLGPICKSQTWTRVD